MTFRIQKKWRWAVAAAAVFVPGIVTGALSLPFTFTAGKPIRASEVNANFEALRAQVDALSGTPVRPAIGTLTVAGLATGLPIRKFSQSVLAPWTSGAAPLKPAASDVQVVVDIGANTPALDLALSQGKQSATADIVIGNFALHLTSVVLNHSTVGTVQAGVPQETLSLSYAAVEWSWQVGTSPKKLVSFDRQSGTGGGSGVTTFKYGYFAAGVDPDAAYVPIAGYTHDIACPAKCAHGPVSVQKGIGSETIDELGLVTSGSSGVGMSLDWFLVAGTPSNSVQLASGFVVGVELTTKDDGTLTESADFAYTKITWKAGTTITTWDVVKGQAL